MVVLLLDVVEGEFHYDLAKGRVGLATRDGVRVPDHVIDLGWLTSLVVVFTDGT